MFNRIRERFGTAGLVVSIMALVLALAGGAYAAAGLNGKQKKEVTKIAKKYAGKPGAPGATGPAGPAGTNGTAGTNGVSITGVAATVGECPTGGVKYTSASGDNVVCNGEDGTSVANTVEPRGANCREGGSKFVGTSTTYACNGSPWTVGGTLPQGATLTGAYGTNYDPTIGTVTAIEFNVPLVAAIGTPANIHIIDDGDPVPGGCDDGAGDPASAANPEADSGHFCLYVTDPFGVGALAPTSLSSPAGGASVGKSGALLLYNPGGGVPFVTGTWAVTG
jgi:hypothetical protein